MSIKCERDAGGTKFTVDLRKLLAWDVSNKITIDFLNRVTCYWVYKNSIFKVNFLSGSDKIQVKLSILMAVKFFKCLFSRYYQIKRYQKIKKTSIRHTLLVHKNTNIILNWEDTAFFYNFRNLVICNRLLFYMYIV